MHFEMLGDPIKQLKQKKVGVFIEYILRCPFCAPMGF